MRHALKIIAMFFLVVFITSCHQKQTANTIELQIDQTQPQEIVIEPVQNDIDWLAIQKSIQNLPESITKYLSSDWLDLLKQASQNNDVSYDEIIAQIDKNKDQLPILYSLPLSLNHNSIYDNTKLNYCLQAPLSNEGINNLVIILDSYPGYNPTFNNITAWKIFIPSRPHMNYQLIAEGDFWNILKDLYSIYPHLQNSNHYIVGDNNSADAALLFANRYPSKFTGIAFSGGSLGLDIDNIDNMPITYFHTSYETLSTPWAGPHLIQRLQQRGNLQATISSTNAIDSIQQLITSSTPSPNNSIKFFDYRYAHVTPWLSITDKISAYDPVNIFINFKDKELSIKTSNAKTVTLNPTLLNDIENITFNNTNVEATTNQETIVIGNDELLPMSTQKKINAPSGFINFWRNEPLYIVYQDSNASAEYLSLTHEIASKFASVNLLGIPHSDINLPLVPLSQYNAQDLPNHRIIIIGQHRYIAPILQDQYFPISWSTNELLINQRIIPISSPLEKIAYGLNYPPSDESSPLKLAFFLAADDINGLNILSKHYTSATTIFDYEDLRIWSTQQDSNYNLIMKQTFDGYWEPSPPSLLIAEIPLEPQEIWETFLEEILIEQARCSTLAITNLIDPYISPISRLTHENIDRFIPNKYFARITIDGNENINIGNQLLQNLPEDAIVMGLDEAITIDPQTQNMLFNETLLIENKPLEFVVDVATLSALCSDTLNQLDYEILPYSLHEMLLQKLKNKKEFAKQFMRLSNEYHI